MREWIGVDFDGTLAFYESKQWPALGEPIPLMQQRVIRWLAAGKDVRIVTARVDGGHAARADGHPNPADPDDQTAKIQEWCLKHLGKALPVTCSKDYAMVELWDDRAVQVIPNTGRTIADELESERAALSGKAAAPVS